MKNKKAFTLVELIVVITILAILATVGFVSFSGYLAGARDTNRIAQLKSMSDALELYRTKKDLPIPDDKVDVQADGTTIAYQGYIGANVLETIEYTEKGLDPKDKNYFSYYLTKNKKYFQLMAFLEEENEDVLAGVFTNTKAVDYSARVPKLLGKKLGVLTDDENTPIQDVGVITGSGYIETKIESDYIAHLEDGKQLEGREISALYEIANEGGFKSNLVAWYDMETIDGNSLFDLSGNHHTGEVFGNFSNITQTGGVIGGSLDFTGNNITDYIVLPNETFNDMKDFTVNIWVKSRDISGNYYLSVANTDADVGNRLLMGTNWSRNRILIKAPFQIYPTENINSDEWQMITFIKNNDEITLLVNASIKEVEQDASISNITIEAEGVVLGQDQDSVLGGFRSNQAFNGEMDDLRIYSGVLTDSRIEELYKLGK